MDAKKRAPEVTWEGFEQFLHDQFGPKNPIRYYTHKLMSIQRGSHETVSAYCSRFSTHIITVEKLSRLCSARFNYCPLVSGRSSPRVSNEIRA